MTAIACCFVFAAVSWLTLALAVMQRRGVVRRLKSLHVRNVATGPNIAPTSFSNQQLIDAFDVLGQGFRSGLTFREAVCIGGVVSSAYGPIASTKDCLGVSPLQFASECFARGETTNTVLRQLEHCASDDAARSFATVTDAIQDGVSIAGTLEAESNALRSQLLIRHRERLATASVRLTIPLVAALLPGFVVLVVIPQLLSGAFGVFHAP